MRKDLPEIIVTVIAFLGLAFGPLILMALSAEYFHKAAEEMAKFILNQ